MPTLDLDPEPSSASLARTFIREQLRSCPSTIVDVVALLVTELATNAVLHARTAFRVVLDQSDHRITVRVEDGSARVPSPRHYPTDAMTGRGLALVEELADNWGVRRSPTGKEVWFEISYGEPPS